MYPTGLCDAIVRGITRQLGAIGAVDAGVVGLHAVPDEKLNSAQLKTLDNGHTGKFKADITGQLLRGDFVAAAGIA